MLCKVILTQFIFIIQCYNINIFFCIGVKAVGNFKNLYVKLLTIDTVLGIDFNNYFICFKHDSFLIVFRIF